MTQNFVVVEKQVYQIVNRSGVKHFKGKVSKCTSSHMSCTKVRFPTREVAKLYSRYRYMKYGEQLGVYWAGNCECYHLTTSKKKLWRS